MKVLELDKKNGAGQEVYVFQAGFSEIELMYGLLTDFALVTSKNVNELSPVRNRAKEMLKTLKKQIDIHKAGRRYNPDDYFNPKHREYNDTKSTK